MDEGERREQIRRELERIEESAKYSASNQFALAQQWSVINLVLGIPASVLAAIAGVAILATTTGRFWAGIIALGAAAFGSTLTVLNPSKKANRAVAAANAYLEVQTTARQERLIDSAARPLDEARKTLGELTMRRDEQNKTADPPNSLARRRGTKNLATGGQDYAVDSPERRH